jgi:hypothetical protein
MGIRPVAVLLVGLLLGASPLASEMETCWACPSDLHCTIEPDSGPGATAECLWLRLDGELRCAVNYDEGESCGVVALSGQVIVSPVERDFQLESGRYTVASDGSVRRLCDGARVFTPRGLGEAEVGAELVNATLTL